MPTNTRLFLIHWTFPAFFIFFSNFLQQSVISPYGCGPVSKQQRLCLPRLPLVSSSFLMAAYQSKSPGNVGGTALINPDLVWKDCEGLWKPTGWIRAAGKPECGHGRACVGGGGEIKKYGEEATAQEWNQSDGMFSARHLLSSIHLHRTNSNEDYNGKNIKRKIQIKLWLIVETK